MVVFIKLYQPEITTGKFNAEMCSLITNISSVICERVVTIVNEFRALDV